MLNNNNNEIYNNNDMFFSISNDYCQTTSFQWLLQGIKKTTDTLSQLIDQNYLVSAILPPSIFCNGQVTKVLNGINTEEKVTNTAVARIVKSEREEAEEYRMKLEAKKLQAVIIFQNKWLDIFKSGIDGLHPQNFTFGKVLGKGGFGQVVLATESYTKKQYAIKIIPKSTLVDADHLKSVLDERRCLQVEDDFLVAFHSSFQSSDSVFFAMEYLSGGTLTFHLCNGPFSLEQIKFYSLEIFFGMTFLHGEDILHRDLKLDNVMLTADGHVKLTDFGACEVDFSKRTSWSVRGTIFYIAPEVATEKDYGFESDWWSFGVMMYAMLSLEMPFDGDTEDEIFDAIINLEPKYPTDILDGVQIDLLQKMLKKNPMERFRYLGDEGRNTPHQFLEHPFFSGVNVLDIGKQLIPPPFVPMSHSVACNFESVPDTGHFSTICSQTGDVDHLDGFEYLSGWARESRANAVLELMQYLNFPI